MIRDTTMEMNNVQRVSTSLRQKLAVVSQLANNWQAANLQITPGSASGAPLSNEGNSVQHQPETTPMSPALKNEIAQAVVSILNKQKVTGMVKPAATVVVEQSRATVTEGDRADAVVP